jgi:recombination protein RecT
MSDTNQLSTVQNGDPRMSLKAYVNDEKIKRKFAEVLGDRAPQFLSALVQVGSDSFLSRCSPPSIAASAMTAATLDLPIQKSLGFAWIVPYRQKDGNYEAQFQIGWRGVVQLALRSGQFQRINAVCVNQEAYRGRDDIGEPIIDWNLLDETKEPAGYAVAWKLINGFTKVAYWSLAKVIAHAQKYSQAYRGDRHTPWKDKDQFHAMALKTVVMNELKRWAPLSVQLQNAMVADGAVRKDIDSEPEMIDLDPEGSRVEEPKPQFISSPEPKEELQEPRKEGETYRDAKPEADHE